jgi:hypothetical protein
MILPIYGNLSGYRVGSPVYLTGLAKDVVDSEFEESQASIALFFLGRDYKQETRDYLCFEEDKCNMYGNTAFTTP